MCLTNNDLAAQQNALRLPCLLQDLTVILRSCRPSARTVFIAASQTLTIVSSIGEDEFIRSGFMLFGYSRHLLFSSQEAEYGS